MIINDNIALTVLIYVVIIAVVVLFVGIILNKNKNVKKSKLSVQNNNNELENSHSETSNTRTNSDLPEDELIAVLTAAVSACMKPGVQSKIRVKSFRRIENNAPIWNLVGRFDRIRNKI